LLKILRNRLFSVVGAFFREIHRADELGSDMRNMMKYGQAYGGEDPQLIEGDVFRIFVKVPDFGAVEEQAKNKDSGEVTPLSQEPNTEIQADVKGL
jgi:ATP-dependent DNA helicase RecG